MKELKDRVAVVTGAASGIGRAMAEGFADEGMKVVLSDIEEGQLAQVTAELEAAGAQVLSVRADVSKPEQVETLARKSVDAFGGVHVLCNNAGVAVGGPGVGTWESTLDDWNWILGVNLMGVIYGVHTFTPIMLAQEGEGHIVNTASMAGLVTPFGNGLYGVTKHAVVALSEAMHNELRTRGAKVKVSVLCPGWVDTRIADADRNRPAALSDVAASSLPPEQAQILEDLLRKALEGGLDSKEVAKLVVDSIREERFYILPHPDWNYMIEHRMQNILEERPADAVLPPGLEVLAPVLRRD
jgi:NAD(P)-dependent dehydrogenase (short-subunit alcohol dehydrogenase family)